MFNNNSCNKHNNQPNKNVQMLITPKKIRRKKAGKMNKTTFSEPIDAQTQQEQPLNDVLLHKRRLHAERQQRYRKNLRERRQQLKRIVQRDILEREKKKNKESISQLVFQNRNSQNPSGESGFVCSNGKRRQLQGDADVSGSTTLFRSNELGTVKCKIRKVDESNPNVETEAANQSQNNPMLAYTERDMRDNIPQPVSHCRFCAKEKQISSLFDIENIKQGFENLCNHLRIHLDWQHGSLPKKICVECFNTLKNAYDLISKVEDKRQKYVQVEEEIVQPPPPTMFVLTETWKDYPWYCTHCGQRFDDMSSLRAHSQEAHAVCYAFHCVDCGGFCNCFDVFVEHVRTHRPSLRQICQYCNQRFISAEVCLAHNAEHWTQALCTQCGQICDDEETLNNHKSSGKYNVQWCTPRLKIIDSLDSWKDYEWICRVCCEQKPDLEALRRHSLEAHGSCFSVKCMDCAQACDSFAKFVEHVRVHRPYLRKYCQYCNVGHMDSVDMKLHVENHLQGHHYCSVCEETFDNDDALVAHFALLSQTSSRHHQLPDV